MPQKQERDSIGRRDLGMRRRGKHTIVNGAIGNGTNGKGTTSVVPPESTNPAALAAEGKIP